MPLALYHAYFSRPTAPTRRIALGDMVLPTEPSPGFGGILLGAVAAHFFHQVDAEVLAQYYDLIDDLEADRRLAQPRMRHRLQTDRVGLRPCRHKLIASDESVHFEFDSECGTPAQNLLGAAYATTLLSNEARASALTLIRRGLRWSGGSDADLLAHLTSRRVITGSSIVDPVGWAMSLLQIDLADNPATPERQVVQRAYREALIEAHPDHGGEAVDAADRIADLVEAKRILLNV